MTMPNLGSNSLLFYPGMGFRAQACGIFSTVGCQHNCFFYNTGHLFHVCHFSENLSLTRLVREETYYLKAKRTWLLTPFFWHIGI